MDDPSAVPLGYGSLISKQDTLLELPAPQEVIREKLSATSAEHLGPTGPDRDRMHKAIAALQSTTDKLRQRQRRSHLADNSEIDDTTKEEIIVRDGRLQAADLMTQHEYLAVGGKLLSRFLRECDLQCLPLEDVDPREFASWLLGLKLKIARVTFRRYRASAINIIQSMPSHFIDEAEAMLRQDLQVGDDDTEFVTRGGDLRAPEHPNRFEHRHFEEAKKQLRVCSGGGQAREWLKDWLAAGIYTGLRPMEWALTDLERRPASYAEHDRVWLHVISAKGRYVHVARTLDLSNFSASALDAVGNMVDRSHDWVLAGHWSRHQHEVEKLLRSICEQRFPRMHQPYGLYSLRHQFIANMKTIYSREEVAAMADHILLEGQTMYNGKKRVAWDLDQISERPAPVTAQVAVIKKRLELVDLRHLDRAQKNAFRERKRDHGRR